MTTQLAIAIGGKPMMPVSVSANAIPSEKFAAMELRSYLARMTMAPIELVDFSEAIKTPYFLVKIANAEEGLGEDGFSIQSSDKKVEISGGVRGVIYAVYELLEQLGCRFFTATCEKVPYIQDLYALDWNEKQIPILELRDHNYFETRKPGFGAKLRLNGACGSADVAKYGGYMKYADFVHSFDKLIPAKKYGESHPEYFSLDKDGKRNTTSARTQLCLTNPEVLELLIDETRKKLIENPDARLMSISQNDWEGNCQCEGCLSSDAAEGGPTGTLINFVNEVAKRLEPEFPNIIFDTLAYQYTRPIPLKTRPRHNVCIRLCSIECCFAHTFEACDQDRGIKLPNGEKTSFINDLRNWGAIHDRLYIWDYTTSFSHYPAPHPNWRTLQPNMQALIKNHVKGVFEQANGASKGGCDLNELRAYIISKLLWNADTNVEQHIKEFTDYYYGGAAPYIRDYINLVCDYAEKENIHVGFNDPCDGPLFREEILTQLESLIQKGEQVVAGDPLRLMRTSKVKLSVRYLRLKRGSMLEGKLDAKELSEFFSDWKEFGLSRMEEWVAPETSLRGFLHHKWRGVEFYNHWTEEPREE